MTIDMMLLFHLKNHFMSNHVFTMRFFSACSYLFYAWLLHPKSSQVLFDVKALTFHVLFLALAVNFLDNLPQSVLVYHNYNIHTFPGFFFDQEIWYLQLSWAHPRPLFCQSFSSLFYQLPYFIIGGGGASLIIILIILILISSWGGWTWACFNLSFPSSSYAHHIESYAFSWWSDFFLAHLLWHLKFY